MRHTSLGTNAQMMVMMQSFRSSAEKKVEEKWSCGLLRNTIYEGGQDEVAFHIHITSSQVLKVEKILKGRADLML